MSLKIIILFFLTFSFCNISCSKDPKVYDGLIKDYGSPSLDGCGWVLEIAGTDYKPDQLGTNFQSDSLRVRVAYEDLGKRTNCGLAPDAIDRIKILTITKL